MPKSLRPPTESNGHTSNSEVAQLLKDLDEMQLLEAEQACRQRRYALRLAREGARFMAANGGGTQHGDD